MSFASEVKKELLSVENHQLCCKKALMLGILQGAGDIVFSGGTKKIVVKSYLLQVIQKLMTLLKDEHGIESTIKYGDEHNLNKIRYYCIRT